MPHANARQRRRSKTHDAVNDRLPAAESMDESINLAIRSDVQVRQSDWLVKMNHRSLDYPKTAQMADVHDSSSFVNSRLADDDGGIVKHGQGYDYAVWRQNQLKVIERNHLKLQKSEFTHLRAIE